MRIGIIVDGQSEFASLPCLVPALEQATGNVVIGPLRADIQPAAPVGVISRSCLSRIGVLRSKKVENVIVLLDREERNDCPGAFARQIQTKLQKKSGIPVYVVVKNRTFENWLVADIEALRAQPARFSVSRSIEKLVSPNKADNVDAERILSRAIVNGKYSKVQDSVRILDRADIPRIASNSRSFRRLLRCLGHPNYVHQSRNP